MSDLNKANTALSKALLPSRRKGTLQVLELGTGCGIVGISLAHTISNANVLLTDLSEAREIVQHNIDQAHLANGSSIKFQELNWDDDLPTDVTSPLDLVLAADCTYNPDSRSALHSFFSRDKADNHIVLHWSIHSADWHNHHRQ